jgi:hypothetical protein
MAIRISPDYDQIIGFCRRWKVSELLLFGSVLRDDFTPDSDVDLLISFYPNAGWSLLDQVAMKEELSGILGRKVDLITKKSVEASTNWIRKKEILETAEPLYVAG